MSFEEQRDLLIQTLWQHVSSGQFAGMTAFDAAVAMGASPSLAEAVQSAWTGPAYLG